MAEAGRQIKAYIVNAFTREDSGGSPTGVLLDAGDLTDEQMQQVSNQLAVSHTAFVIEPTVREPHLIIRFFTPHGEILNCGHGTIAAHYTRVIHFDLADNPNLFQQAKEGLQQIEIASHGDLVEIFLHQNPIQLYDHDPDSALLVALGISSADLDERFPLIIASPGVKRFLLAVRTQDILNNIIPDFEKLKQTCKSNECMGCFVYCIDALRPVPEATARMFAPNIGVNEDIINGNSSGCLGAYLLKLDGGSNLALLIKQGQQFNCHGLVKVKAKRSGDNFETVIGGRAKIEREIILDIR